MRKSLTNRILFFILAIYFFVVIALTAVFIALEYNVQKTAIKEELHLTESAFLDSLNATLYSLDEEALGASVSSLLKLPSIVGVQVWNTKNVSIIIGGTLGNDEGKVGEVGLHVNVLGLSKEDQRLHEDTYCDMELFTHEFLLNYKKLEQNVPLGSAKIYSSSHIIFERMKVSSFMLFTHIFLSAIAFLISVYFILDKYLRKPLDLLTANTSKLSLENISLFKIPSELLKREDEIGYFSKSMTSVVEDLSNAISEKISMQESLSRNEQNLDITLNSIGDAVIATDIHGNVTRLNPVAEQLTGWTFEETRGKHVGDFFIIINSNTRKTVASPVEKVLESGKSVDLANHTVLISKTGKESQIADSAAPITTKEGKIVGVVLVFRDMTEEYKLQEQLQQSQKMDAVGQLAGGVAHDFNNMLGGIMGSAELMDEYIISESPLEELQQIIIESSERAALLTRKLLAFSRKQPISQSIVDCHVPIANAVELLKNTIDKRVAVEMDLTAERSNILGDSSQIQNIFLNLGINACHAMPKGGVINISSQVLHLDSIYCKNSLFEIEPGEYLEVGFTDTGEGMPTSMLSRIFEPFFTTKEKGKGTGLGLSVAYGTMQQHNGAINVYSEEGRGTKFYLLFPLETSLVQKDAGTPEDIVKGEGRVLVVDDEYVMRKTARSVIRRLGYTVTLAEDGQEGLDVFEGAPDEFDIVLLDMIMPRMNGKDCFIGMRKIRKDIPVIIASGFTQIEDINELKEMGLNAFINKPYRTAQLSELISKHIAK